MFCCVRTFFFASVSNWGVRVARLNADISYAEQDRIISDSNNKDGVLRVLITMDQVGRFGINLQLLSGCNHIIIADLPLNLNTILQSVGRL